MSIFNYLIVYPVRSIIFLLLILISLGYLYEFSERYCMLVVASHSSKFIVFWGLGEAVSSIVGNIIAGVSVFSLLILPQGLRKVGRWIIISCTVCFTLVLLYFVWSSCFSQGLWMIIKAVLVTPIPITLAMFSIFGTFISEMGT